MSSRRSKTQKKKEAVTATLPVGWEKEARNFVTYLEKAIQALAEDRAQREFRTFQKRATDGYHAGWDFSLDGFKKWRIDAETDSTPEDCELIIEALAGLSDFKDRVAFMAKFDSERIAKVELTSQNDETPDLLPVRREHVEMAVTDLYTQSKRTKKGTKI